MWSWTCRRKNQYSFFFLSFSFQGMNEWIDDKHDHLLFVMFNNTYENWHIFLLLKIISIMVLIFLLLFLLFNNRQVKFPFHFLFLLSIYLHILKSLVKCSRKSFWFLSKSQSCSFFFYSRYEPEWILIYVHR